MSFGREELVAGFFGAWYLGRLLGGGGGGRLSSILFYLRKVRLRVGEDYVCVYVIVEISSSMPWIDRNIGRIPNQLIIDSCPVMINATLLTSIIHSLYIETPGQTEQLRNQIWTTKVAVYA